MNSPEAAASVLTIGDVIEGDGEIEVDVVDVVEVESSSLEESLLLSASLLLEPLPLESLLLSLFDASSLFDDAPSLEVTPTLLVPPPRSYFGSDLFCTPALFKRSSTESILC